VLRVCESGAGAGGAAGRDGRGNMCGVGGRCNVCRARPARQDQREG